METKAITNGKPSEEWMLILNCNEPKGNHAIYKKLNKKELYRRYSLRRKSVDYFNRPAIWHNNKWYPEKYRPDPEDHEWSWKEGIEVDKPGQSLYQLTVGRPLWERSDPSPVLLSSIPHRNRVDNTTSGPSNKSEAENLVPASRENSRTPEENAPLYHPRGDDGARVERERDARHK